MSQAPQYIVMMLGHCTKKNGWENSKATGLKLARILESEGKHDRGGLRVTLFRCMTGLG